MYGIPEAMFSPRNKDGRPAVYDEKQGQPPPNASMTNVSVRRTRPRQRPNRFLFRVAFARARPCYCYGCICLTKDERAYERRVFRLARAWGLSWQKPALRPLERDEAAVGRWLARDWPRVKKKSPG